MDCRSIHIEIDESHPANAGILEYLRESTRDSLSQSRHIRSCSPTAVDDPYYTLGTHPELVARLWDEITVELPVKCNWIVHGVPVLVRPDTGIIFGFARGTFTYALRLPERHRNELNKMANESANKRANESGLTGKDREHYIREQTGNILTYSDGSAFDIATISEHWILCRFLDRETLWRLAGYENAA